MARSALKLALAAEKGRDPRDKKHKRILKEKQQVKLDKKNRGVLEVDSDDDIDEEVSGSESGGASIGIMKDGDEEMIDQEDDDERGSSRRGRGI